MAMTPEGAVKKKVKKILDDLNIWYFNPSMNGFGRAGIPDFVCCAGGTFVGIECKAGSNQPTALQARELEAIAKHGGFAFVVNEVTVNDLSKKLKMLT